MSKVLAKTTLPIGKKKPVKFIPKNTIHSDKIETITKECNTWGYFRINRLIMRIILKSNLNKSELLVLLHILDCTLGMNRYECYYDIKRLVEVIDISAASIYLSLTTLEDKGCIERGGARSSKGSGMVRIQPYPEKWKVGIKADMRFILIEEKRLAIKIREEKKNASNQDNDEDERESIVEPNVSPDTLEEINDSVIEPNVSPDTLEEEDWMKELNGWK